MKSDVVMACADMFEVHPRDLVSRHRFAFLMRPRQALYKVLHSRGWSYAEIGRFMDRDHTTVMHGVRQATIMMARDPEYAKKIERLIALTPENLSELPKPTYRWAA